MKTLNEIIRTKFFPPNIPFDYIPRKTLLDTLERNSQQSVILVSASAGFGKSTLIADFLKKRNGDFSWLSLSEKENEIKEFIKYFIKTIQVKVKQFGAETLELTYATRSPAVEELAVHLMNDMAKFDNTFYLVIDDYHFIRNQDIHDFLAKLFEYPQPFFKLVLITRRDPELPLSDWRVKNIMVEIRSSDLRFRPNEIVEFYSKSISFTPDEKILSKLVEFTDGWITGLRMITLSTNNPDELQEHFLNYKYNNSRIISELVIAVLSKQPSFIKDSLIKLSLLKEFNIELFSELCLNSEEQKHKENLFQKFTSTILDSNMFIIPLDDKLNWFRFHHLFIDKLYDILLIEYDKMQIEELRLRVANWYYKNHYYEDAILFYLRIRDYDKALEVFSKYKLKLISKSNFNNLETVYNLFPENLASKKAVLLLTKAWIYFFKGNIVKMAELAEPVEELIENEKHQRFEYELMLGEIFALKAYDLYLAHIDMKKCLEIASKSITLLKGKNPYAFGLAWIFYGGSMQILHSADSAKKQIYSELEIATTVEMKSQLLLVLWYIDWFEADFQNSIRTGKKLLELGIESNHKMSIAHGNGFIGRAYFSLNKTDEALPYLKESVKFKNFAIQSVGLPPIITLALIYAEKRMDSDRDEIIGICEKEVESGGKRFLKMLEAINADISFNIMGNIGTLKWAKENDFTDYLPLLSYYNPEITQARLLALDSETSSWNLSLKIIDLLLPVFQERNNINFIIRSLTVKSVVLYKLGNIPEAFELLQSTIELSASRGFLRPFIELGSIMRRMLEECKIAEKYEHFVDEISNHFPYKEENVVLTRREKEILRLSEMMTNKEIGNQLFIAEKTVKSHITNINKKLNTVTRVESLKKAKELTLI